jgi:hypothetical protein
MIEAASEPIPSPLLAAIVAAAPANENCNINADLTKIDDEATTSGCIASQQDGSFVVGVTTIICCDGVSICDNFSTEARKGVVISGGNGVCSSGLRLFCSLLLNICQNTT